jgi:hypothetical protein
MRKAGRGPGALAAAQAASTSIAGHGCAQIYQGQLTMVGHRHRHLIRAALPADSELAAWVEAGPDPERDGVVRWRRVDLKRRIQAGFGVEMHERSVGKQLRAPAPPGAAAEAPEGRLRRPGGVQKDFPETVAAAIPEHARGKPIEIWFQELTDSLPTCRGLATKRAAGRGPAAEEPAS